MNCTKLLYPSVWFLLSRASGRYSTSQTTFAVHPCELQLSPFQQQPSGLKLSVTVLDR